MKNTPTIHLLLFYTSLYNTNKSDISRYNVMVGIS